MLTLVMLESGKVTSIDQIKDLKELIAVFNVLMRMERLRRQGFIRLPKTLSLDNEQGFFELTEKGQSIADQVKTLFDQR